MARYTAGECLSYVSKQQAQIEDAIRVIDRYLAELELEFANTLEKNTMSRLCNDIKDHLVSISKTAGSYRFE